MAAGTSPVLRSKHHLSVPDSYSILTATAHSFFVTSATCVALERNGVRGKWINFNDFTNANTPNRNRARYCQFPFGRELCTSLPNLIYEVPHPNPSVFQVKLSECTQDCETLSDTQCAQCQTSLNSNTFSDGNCPIIRQDILRCYMAPSSHCLTKSQCESSGKFNSLGALRHCLTTLVQAPAPTGTFFGTTACFLHRATNQSVFDLETLLSGHHAPQEWILPDTVNSGE